MKAINIFVPCLAIMVISSCGIRDRMQMDEMMRQSNQIINQIDAENRRDRDNLAQKIAAQDVKNAAWIEKWKGFLNTLSNTELKANSEMEEALKNHEDAKLILARRNFLNQLIKSPEKYVTYQKLIREVDELCKENDKLNAKMSNLNKAINATAQYRASMEEERKHEEMVSAIKGVSSSIDTMRFDLEQWKMQQFLKTGN